MYFSPEPQHLSQFSIVERINSLDEVELRVQLLFCWQGARDE
jgi:hypothetical protein